MGGRTGSSRVAAALVTLLLAATGAVVSLAVSAAPAAALCSDGRPLADDWRNIDASTRSMTRAIVAPAGCDDVRRCDANTGKCTGGTGLILSVRLFGKCHPTDCDWGTRTLTRSTDGWYYAVYDFGFKRSTAWVRTYEYYGRTYLRVYVHNDFSAADGRTDYTTDEWMLPA